MGRLRISAHSRRGGSLRTGHGRVVARHAFVADRHASRLVGMIGTPDLRDDEALVLRPCRSVHGLGLRVAIGAAFADGTGTVLRLVDPLPPRGASCRRAHLVVEAASGVLGVRPGDRLILTDAAGFPLDGHFSRTDGGSGERPRALPGHREHEAPSDDRRT